ncbi:MAG: GAF domain-containing protein [Saprospiraceae bacterium]|nr:GAF domain-containing protein [Saprospiraceae bacterium]
MPEVIDNNLQILEMEYMPLAQMIEMMEQREQLHYKSSFSFEPYLNAVDTKMHSACPNTKGALIPIIENTSKYIEKEDNLDALLESVHFQTLVSLVVPSMFFKDDRSFICAPFKKKVLVSTPAHEELLDPEKWEIKIPTEKILENKNHSFCQAGTHILNTFYGQDLDMFNGFMITLRNKQNNMERYYQLSFKLDFVEVVALKDLPKLSQETINMLIANLGDEDLWLKHLPADHFAFKGFSTGHFYDVSEIETLSRMKQWLNEDGDDKQPHEFLAELTSYMQSFLNRSEVQAGTIMTEYEDLHRNQITSLTKLPKESILGEDDARLSGVGIYGEMARLEDAIVIENLSSLKNPSIAEKALMKNGIQSIVLAPIVNNHHNVISVLEVGSPKPNDFNASTLKKLTEVLDVLKMGYEKYMTDIENRITGLIQQKYTSIHPSVQWKFQDVAMKHLTSAIYKDEDLTPDSIVFHDVYPLYAQSDIVGSSKLRNEAIQADLIKNLKLLSDLLTKLFRKKNLPLLDAHLVKVNKVLRKIEENFVSNDETSIVNMIVKEINPFLLKLSKRHKSLMGKAYSKYVSALDPELGIVYEQRKAFETSVNQLNSKISNFLEADNNELQKSLPHYFEKYKTDGVEYNMYIGKDITENGDFDYDDLRNFRLWQLINTCEIVRLVEDTKPKLATSLDTASLIFVYNHALSIRFRMDEKRFDVDGAYNVRYEILKKRIDKAYVKGKDERLTLSGKIAIVYLSEQDKNEYLQFFEYLIEKGYIENNIEDLELDKLQGAEGLKALRVTVI